MSILSGYKKFKKYLKTTDGYQLISYITSSDTVNMVDENGNITDTTLTESISKVGKGRELTQAEYDALSEEEKRNGTVYYITDGKGVVIENASSITFDNTTTGLVADNVQAAIEEIENNAFSGNYNDLSNKPNSLKNPQKLTFTGGVTGAYDGSTAKEIAIPTSLPANGGNSDTVDNKHASDFILKSGGTMSGALNLGNGIWNKIGNDAYLGDANMSGCVCLRTQTANSDTGICFIDNAQTTNEKLSFINGNQLYADRHFGVGETLWVDSIANRTGNTIIESAHVVQFRVYQAEVKNQDNSAWSPIYASGFGQQSSHRVKENIKEMSKEEARKILLLNPVTYDYKNKKNGTECRGLIAEDVAPIIPSCVIGDVNCADDDEKAIETIGIDYSKLVPYLIKMMQLQQDEINELKNTLCKS